MALPDASGASYQNPPKPTFASLLSKEQPLQFSIDDLPSPYLEEGFTTIRISESSFLRGLENCKTNLVGRVSLPPKCAPLKAHELMRQLRGLWPALTNWTVSPLGKGFFMLRFNSIVDMQRIWSIGSIKLQSGVLRFIKWTPTFSPSTYQNSFAQVWVRLWDLNDAYWDPQTLFEIAKGIGMPIKLDTRTLDRSVGLYARILVDVDFSRPLLSHLRVTRDVGAPIVIGLEYESVHDVCSACGNVGHNEQKCRVQLNRDAPPSPDIGTSSVPATNEAEKHNIRGRSITRSKQTRHRGKRSQGRSIKGSLRPPLLKETDGANPLVDSSAAHNNINTDLSETVIIRAEPFQATDKFQQTEPSMSSSSMSVPPGFQKIQ